ncbi:MAG: biosynthetic arginine decarboxylase [Gammaproteobacteria bacterium]|nr:biosynthetic arginine decarboxylase [Gammaproteobacteria bacterium]
MSWSIEQSRTLYNISRWSEGFFDINQAGHLVARTNDANGGVDDGAAVSLYQLSKEIKEDGLALPLLVRFPGILRQRVARLCAAFDEAMQADSYRGNFTAVYPIKVNQQRSVVEEILRSDQERVGLEAGSKAELIAVLALSRPESGIIVCNGYKDREYIRLALIGTQLGHRVYIVIEKLSELEKVIQEARRLDVVPQLGIRIRLTSIGAGKWQNSGGAKSKFGLCAAQVLQAIEQLRHANMLDTLVLMHFHLGSQVSNIGDIQRGAVEAARYYAELHRLGANIRCVDIGGGLGVDYEGTRSRSFCSMNYSIQEYARNIVHTLREICEELSLPHPDIISESGRAITAHHAVLITNVIDTERAGGIDTTPVSNGDDDNNSDEEIQLLKDMRDSCQTVTSRPALEVYHDIVHQRSEAEIMYTHGVLSLEQWAQAEQIFFATCRTLQQRLKPALRAHRKTLDELNEKLADKYFCNFSLFQSMPDAWAIDQVFPIVPLHRLDERPTQRAIIHDITCDSDGCIEQYVDEAGIESTLPVHPLIQGQPYLLGIFLVGAYQEILGDMHNLFGDTDSVNVEIDADGNYRRVEPTCGDSVESVLRYVHINADELLKIFRDKVERSGMSEAQSSASLASLEVGLSGYTYLED